MESVQTLKKPDQQKKVHISDRDEQEGNAEVQSRRLEERYRHNQKLESIGQLAAGIAHEINTPIQYLGDNIRFLQDSFEDIKTLLTEYNVLLKQSASSQTPFSAISNIENIIKETDMDYVMNEVPRAIEQSIEGLGNVTKIVTAMKQFCHPGIEEKKSTDLNQLIENVITVARNELKYAADINMDFDQSLPSVYCVAGEINQVILNMLINAAHAIKEAVDKGQKSGKGTISISTVHDNSWAEIRIKDSGSGIPEEIRSRIFDPFFTTKEVGKGTGQGLAISYTVIVKKHGGTIDVVTASGEGTTMIIRLPLAIKDE